MVRGPGDEPNKVERALALFEDLEKQFDLVLEGQTGLVKRFDECEKTQQRLEKLESIVFEKVMIKGFGELWKAVGTVQGQIEALRPKC